MRIAHILRKYVPAEWGGTETALHRLTEGLTDHGAGSIAYCPAVPGVTGPDPLAESGCTVKRFHACVPVWGISPADERRMLAVGGNLLSFQLPWMLAREPGLSVIHSHTLGRLGGIAGTVARRRNLPFVVTIHGGVLDLPPELKEALNRESHGGVEWGRLFGWWWRARHVLAEADAILTCNQREANLLRAQHPDQRVLVQPHGVKTGIFRADHREAALAAYPELANRDVLLCVGRIDPVKNQHWVIEEAAEIVKRHPRVQLVFAGSCTNAEYGARVHRDVARLGLGGHVLMTGGLPPGDPRLIGLMQLARAFVLPSRSETFGLVILEAWAAGAPVISSRTSGASGLMRDGENGWLFDLDDPAAFHRALDRTLGEPDLVARLGQASSRIADEYDIRVLAGRLLDLYRGLSEEKKYALRDSA